MHTRSARAAKGNPTKKARERVEHPHRRMGEINPSGQGGEDEQTNRREQQRVLARPLVRQVAEQELPDDGSGEGNVAQVMPCGRRLPDVAILHRQEGDDGSDDLALSVRKKLEGKDQGSQGG